MKIIGIDHSTNPKKRGVSIADYTNGTLKLEYKGLYKNKNKNKDETEIEAVLIKTLKENKKILIAIDAPLGWPINMGKYLASHKAGIGFDKVLPNKFFRRETDFIVKKLTGKQPLDIGADKIARSAFSALNMINEFKNMLSCDIELAWSHDVFMNNSDKQVKLIEVYPAATLLQHGINIKGYKKTDGKNERKRISNELITKERMNIEITDFNNMIDDDNVLDSVVCILAGLDFLKGECYPPENLKIAQKEGWIWFKNSLT